MNSAASYASARERERERWFRGGKGKGTGQWEPCHPRRAKGRGRGGGGRKARKGELRRLTVNQVGPSLLVAHASRVLELLPNLLLRREESGLVAFEGLSDRPQQQPVSPQGRLPRPRHRGSHACWLATAMQTMLGYRIELTARALADPHVRECVCVCVYGGGWWSKGGAFGGARTGDGGGARWRLILRKPQHLSYYRVGAKRFLLVSPYFLRNLLFQEELALLPGLLPSLSFFSTVLLFFLVILFSRVKRFILS